MLDPLAEWRTYPSPYRIIDNGQTVGVSLTAPDVVLRSEIGGAQLEVVVGGIVMHGLWSVVDPNGMTYAGGNQGSVQWANLPTMMGGVQ